MGPPLTILDAYGVVAAIAGERARADVERLRYGDDQSLRISAANLAEVVDRLVRVHGFPLRNVVRQVDLIRAGGLDLVVVDEAIGQRAGDLRAVHYHRERSAVSLADCLALATAESVGEALATPDPALAAMARAEGIEVIPLPDSRGRRP